MSMQDQLEFEQCGGVLTNAGPWPLEAFDFVQRGLQDTARRIHDQLDALGERDHHVSGQELCLGLRDYAIDQYGLLAPMVLEMWHITRTDDFGRMVFAMIEEGLMQSRPEDALDDFRGVYDFREAFDPRSLQSRIGEPNAH
jgi:uncharacterized repeat protein (TIGR04138 family)